MRRWRSAFLLLWLAGWLGLAWLMLTPLSGLPSVPDKLAHFGVYLVMSGFSLSFCTSQRGLFAVMLLTLLAGSGLEYAQGFVPGRSFEPADIAANGAGTLAGYLLAASLLFVGSRTTERSPG